jgi:hypothetical protein
MPISSLTGCISASSLFLEQELRTDTANIPHKVSFNVLLIFKIKPRLM